jgi:hypothetical protein
MCVSGVNTIASYGRRTCGTLGALPLPAISAFTRVFDALWRAEGWGEGYRERFCPPYSSAEPRGPPHAASTGYEGGRRSALILKDFFPSQGPGQEGSLTAAAGQKIFALCH